jgi:two-component sensor histidine kinase
MPLDANVSRRPVTAAARHLASLVLAVALVAAATLVRSWLAHRLVPGLSVFGLYYPAILASALIGGEGAALVALGLSTALGWRTLALSPTHLEPLSIQANILIFVLTAAFIGGVGAALRRLLHRRRVDFLRLSDSEARYRALFEGMAEGFSLVEPVYEDGEAVDFVVLEVNPAMLDTFHLTPGVIGHRVSEHRRPASPEYLPACRRALRDGAVRIEYSPFPNRWFEVRMSRVSENLIAQIWVDITEHKELERHKTEMFNELNHRVKNNLAAVSAMLSIQARAAEEPQVREQLEKAVARIETIGEVHASLYRASSTGEVDFSTYLEKLCGRLAASLLDGERVHIEVAADPVAAPLEEAVALGLIVNELVTNAAKHAYPAPARGGIRVSLHSADNELTLAVSDDGKGLAQGDRPNGIGMRLVRSLVQQCRGKLEVVDKDGASFIIRLPQHGAPAAAQPSLV